LDVSQAQQFVTGETHSTSVSHKLTKKKQMQVWDGTSTESRGDLLGARRLPERTSEGEWGRHLKNPVANACRSCTKDRTNV